MSQSEFGAAIGVSRETIGRIERSTEQLDRRTELVMRYIAEGRLARMSELSEIYDTVATVLDQAAVRGSPPYDYRNKLQAAIFPLARSKVVRAQSRWWFGRKVCWNA